jgi:hypothetical protein
MKNFEFTKLKTGFSCGRNKYTNVWRVFINDKHNKFDDYDDFYGPFKNKQEAIDFVKIKNKDMKLRPDFKEVMESNEMNEMIYWNK